MKLIYGLFASASLVITICLFIILKNGASIRAAPLIRPTALGPNIEKLSEHLSLRLFPDLQSSHYWIWGVDPSNSEATQTIELMISNYQKQFNQTVNRLKLTDNMTPEDIFRCEKPCWIFTTPEKSNELRENNFIRTQIASTQREYRTITWMDFERIQSVPQHCVDEKLLSLECMKIVSVHDAEKKMKDTNQRYFFLKKYLDHDLFIFVQKPLL